MLLVEEKVEASRARPADRADIDALAGAVGIAGVWWQVSGQQTVVTPHTKLALLDAMRLPARTQAQARESLSALPGRNPRTQTAAVGQPDARRRAATGAASQRAGETARNADYRIVCEDGVILEGKTRLGEGARVELPDGRAVLEGALALPELPIGRHRLEVDGVASVLTIAPPECFSPPAVWRRRFGVSAQLYALRRGADDEGIGGLAALGEASAAAGAAGAAYFGVSPLHALFTHNPGRASPYHPSDRRFLNPLLIDVLADGDGPGLEDTTARQFRRAFRRPRAQPGRRLRTRLARQARCAEGAVRGVRGGARRPPDRPRVCRSPELRPRGRRDAPAVRALRSRVG